MSAPLLAGEHEQLRIEDVQLGDGVLEAASGLDSGADSVDPLSRNGFDVLLAVNHEGECVERMSGPVGAVAAWFSATPMGQYQGAGESIDGNVDARQEPAFAALQGGSLGPCGRVWIQHLMVIIQSDCRSDKPPEKCFIEPEVTTSERPGLYF